MTEQPSAPPLAYLHVASWTVDSRAHHRASVDLEGLRQFAAAIDRAGHPVSLWRTRVEPTRWQWLDGEAWRRYRWALALPPARRGDAEWGSL